MQDRFETGMSVRREVLGDAHVDRAEAGKSSFDEPFQNMITEGAWGTLWSDDSISKRERSMLTLSLLAATGSFEEIPMHIRATATLALRHRLRRDPLDEAGSGTRVTRVVEDVLG